jgi:hypothetical protein
MPRRLVASSEFAEIWQTFFGWSREKRHSRARNGITHLSGVDYMRDSETFFKTDLSKFVPKAATVRSPISSVVWVPTHASRNGTASRSAGCDA